jgi:hypothetical protein
MPNKIQLWICEKIGECGIKQCIEDANKPHAKKTFCEVGFYCEPYGKFVKCIQIKDDSYYCSPNCNKDCEEDCAQGE